MTASIPSKLFTIVPTPWEVRTSWKGQYANVMRVTSMLAIDEVRHLLELSYQLCKKYICISYNRVFTWHWDRIGLKYLLQHPQLFQSLKYSVG